MPVGFAQMPREPRDAASPWVLEAFDLLDSLAVPGDEVEQHTFAQRPRARDHLLGRQPLQYVIGQAGAGDDGIDTLRIEPLNTQAFLAVGFTRNAAHPTDLLRRHGKVMETTVSGLAALVRRDGNQIEHGP